MKYVWWCASDPCNSRGKSNSIAVVRSIVKFHSKRYKHITMFSLNIECAKALEKFTDGTKTVIG